MSFLLPHLTLPLTPLLCPPSAPCQVDEDLVSFLLPYLLGGLGSGATPDYRSATYMDTAQLATRVTLSDDLAEGAPAFLA